MEYRNLGKSGLKVPVLSFGAGTFGGSGPLFSNWGQSDTTEARRLIDICLEAGVNLFDTADVYSDGASEEVLGEAIKGRRDQVLISTKSTLPIGDGPNDAGSSRFRLIRSVENALRRLQTDHIDIFQLHAFDAFTPVEEVLSTLDTLVRDGKIRYVGVSNFAGWQIMKALAVADRHGWPRYVVNQVYYSLVGRDYEWDLMPLGQDQGLGAMVWSPLGWGRLTGKIRRGAPLPEGSRLHETASFGPPVEDEHLYRVVDALDAVAKETGKTIPQIALNWLLQRPTVSSVIVGAQRGAASPEPGRHRLVPDARTGGEAGRDQRCDRALSAFPLPAAGGLCPHQSADGGIKMRRRRSTQMLDRHGGMPTALGSRIPLASLIQTLAVAEHLSFYRAAQALGTSQSSVSARIKTLEEEWGILLFERNTRGVRLAEAGRRFVERVSAGVEQLDHAVKTAGMAASGERGRLRIGIHALVPHSFPLN